MFSTLRRYVKWHQTRQIAPDGRFVALKRLVAWYGACGLDESGLVMPANDNWPPELLDLLTRLCQFTGGQQYNSCHLSLFRTGHDLEPWHAHQHACLGANPSIAVISLGQCRSCVPLLCVFSALFTGGVLGSRGRVRPGGRLDRFGSSCLTSTKTRENASHSHGLNKCF